MICSRHLHLTSLEDIFTHFFGRHLHFTSLEDIFTSLLWKTSSPHFFGRHLHFTSLEDIFSSLLWKTSSLHFFGRHLHLISLEDIFTSLLWKTPYNFFLKYISCPSKHKQVFEVELELTSPHLMQSQFHERVMHIVSKLHNIYVKSEQ